MNSGAIVTIIFLCVLLIIFGPLLTIWSINTLFPIVAIPYSMKTWFAIVVFGGLFKSLVFTNKS